MTSEDTTSGKMTLTVSKARPGGPDSVILYTNLYTFNDSDIDLKPTKEPIVMSDQQKPRHGDLQVWHIPQIPGKPFLVPVDSLAQGVKVMDTLNQYDTFQLENNIKGDYASGQGINEFCPDAEDPSSEGTWYSWCNDETDDPREWVNSQKDD